MPKIPSISIIEPDVVRKVSAHQSLLKQRTRAKTAVELIKFGVNALTAALAEQDIDRRRLMLRQLGFEDRG